MKKNFFKAIAIVLSTCSVLTTAFACGGKPIDTDNTGDAKRIEVKCVVAGYGTDWLDAIAKKFNEVYADEGYEVVITLKDTELNAKNEISNPKKCTTDLFFEYNNIDPLINKSRSILKKDGVSVLEDLSDILNKPAIGFDKKEQGKKLIDRFSDNVKDAVSYKGKLKGFDGMYGITWQGGSAGIYVNQKVLNDNGLTLENLLTTDDLLAVVKKLAPEPTDANLTNPDLFFPVSWSGAKAPGYWDYLFQILMAQYEGAKSYQDFWDFTPATGTIKENGYDVYNKDGIYEGLKVVNELLNKDYAVPGTTSMDHIGAQARVATGKSLLMVTGDHIYKELEKDYSAQMKDVIAIRNPVISSLGVKLNLCGATHQKDASCVACNERLRGIIKSIDEDTLTNEKIAEQYDSNVTADKVATIRSARGYYLGNGNSVLASIPSYADAKNGAKKFLSFMFSDDSMKIYKSKTYVDLPLSYVNKQATSEEPFMEYMSKKTNSSNSLSLKASSYNSKIRNTANVSMYPYQGTITTTYTGLSYSHSHGKAEFTPASVFEKNFQYVQSSWADYLRQAGMDK